MKGLPRNARASGFQVDVVPMSRVWYCSRIGLSPYLGNKKLGKTMDWKILQ